MNIPFSTEQFFQVIENYNSGTFPAQIIILILTAAAFMLIFSKMDIRSKVIGSFLGLLWIWIGWVYHLAFFTAINPAAHGFGGLFITQGLLILLYTYRNRLLFIYKPEIKDYTGILLIIFGLIIYPAISYFNEGTWLKTISMGLPCPSTILTFGFFLLTAGKFPVILLVIPSLWSILGLSATMNFGVYQDVMLIVSAIIADAVLVRKKSTLYSAASAERLHD